MDNSKGEKIKLHKNELFNQMLTFNKINPYLYYRSYTFKYLNIKINNYFKKIRNTFTSHNSSMKLREARNMHKNAW